MDIDRAAAVAAGLFGSPAAFAQAEGATVAFLMPDQASTRYEEHDYPGLQGGHDRTLPDLHGDLPECQR